MAMEVIVVCDSCGKKATPYTDPTSTMGFPQHPAGWVTLGVTAHAEPVFASSRISYSICPECREKIRLAIAKELGAGCKTIPI